MADSRLLGIWPSKVLSGVQMVSVGRHARHMFKSSSKVLNAKNNDHLQLIAYRRRERKNYRFEQILILAADSLIFL
jgi:hypothetical protein